MLSRKKTVCQCQEMSIEPSNVLLRQEDVTGVHRLCMWFSNVVPYYLLIAEVDFGMVALNPYLLSPLSLGVM